jgi:hypothetical protein
LKIYGYLFDNQRVDKIHRAAPLTLVKEILEKTLNEHETLNYYE